MTRCGFTLHEMIISLVITAAVVALASSAAMGQLRFFRGVGEVVALRAQLGHATSISANVLRGVTVSTDILVAQDSAFEADVTVGSAFLCETDTGVVTLPAPSGMSGNTLGSYARAPQTGDAAHVSVEDSVDTGWIRLEVAEEPSAGQGCAAFPFISRIWRIVLREPLVVTSGAAIRLTRRTRMSLYRASDDQWYLGVKEWNGVARRFNTIQPVAGPLQPYSFDPQRTGLRFEYRDAAGSILPSPAEPGLIASIAVIARGESVRPVKMAGLFSSAGPRYADSLAVAVALRQQP